MKLCFRAEGFSEGHEAQHGELRTGDEGQRRCVIWSGHDKPTQILKDCDMRGADGSAGYALLTVRTERTGPALAVRCRVRPCAGWVSMTAHLLSSAPSYYANDDVQGYENFN